MPLNPAEMLRYSRHFPVITDAGQEQLKQAKVFCVGAGGLGSPALLYLAAAGIGTLAVIDHDTVEASNLQRQVLFADSDIGQLKAACAEQKLTAQNPHIQVIAHPIQLTRENASDLIAAYDIVLDGSDNYQTRYLINDVCHFQNKPLVSASIFQFQGQLGVFNYKDGPCYRCLYNAPPPAELTPSCSMSGVLGILPGIMGTLQATEVIKLILKKGEVLSGRLLAVDALNMDFKKYQVHPDPFCPLCKEGRLSDELFTQPSVCLDKASIPEIEPHQLASWLQDQPATFRLLDVREDYEREIYHIGGDFLPLGQLDTTELNWNKEEIIVVYCKAGGRSMKAAQLLNSAGYKHVYSLKGGILAWIQEVEATPSSRA